MTKLFTITIFLLLSITIFAQTQEPELIGDRPDMTESAHTITKRHLQVETGFDYTLYSSELNEFTFHSTLFRYGILKNAELRLGFSNGIINFQGKTENEYPLYIGTKVHILTNKVLIPELAVLVSTGIEEVWEADVSILNYTPTLIISGENELAPNISIGYNIGAEYSTYSKEITGIVSASLGIGLGDKSGAFAELAWFPSKHENDARFNAGFTHQFTNSFQFDIYVGLGLLSDSPAFNTGTGLIFLF